MNTLNISGELSEMSETLKKMAQCTPYLHYEGKLPLAVKSVTRCVNTTDRTNNVDACMYMSIYNILIYYRFS